MNVGFTRSIVGMDDEEARPLLRRLYRQSTIVDVQCRFRWRPGSVAFWDNRATQHVVSNDFLPAKPGDGAGHDRRRQALLTAPSRFCVEVGRPGSRSYAETH